jgi:hypothetical protein
MVIKRPSEVRMFTTGSQSIVHQTPTTLDLKTRVSSAIRRKEGVKNTNLFRSELTGSRQATGPPQGQIATMELGLEKIDFASTTSDLPRWVGNWYTSLVL